MSAEQGYHVELDLVDARISALTRLGGLTGDLVARVRELAERQPMLGTAPPAVELAGRLRAAAGQSGLAGVLGAAERELEAFLRTLAEVRATYAERESDTGAAVRAIGEPGTARSSTGGAW
ncbi:hypothetical protein [Saccharothrix coeruleofusca]|uniref:Excreted virulence factor EspC (Type VII ESX diderm) n=1 Tax=Saccharothrix coeruleofusca TaxID=33919 RepID=A0A918ALD9_9PSEU|nr:hypothetical protein [Saccharothrix coeruleofusca]GGP55688.1 hypothetical protein GCM10010185_30330 [Saccharothrix coeruleofusca]